MYCFGRQIWSHHNFILLFVPGFSALIFLGYFFFHWNQNWVLGGLLVSLMNWFSLGHAEPFSACTPWYAIISLVVLTSLSPIPPPPARGILMIFNLIHYFLSHICVYLHNLNIFLPSFSYYKVRFPGFSIYKVNF